MAFIILWRILHYPFEKYEDYKFMNDVITTAATLTILCIISLAELKLSDIPIMAKALKNRYILQKATIKYEDTDSEFNSELLRAKRGTIIASLNYCRHVDVGWKHDAGLLADKLMEFE